MVEVLVPLDPQETLRTACICAVCGEDDPLTFTEEVFHLQVTQLQMFNGEPVFHPVINEETGDFQFDPYFFHFGCWEDIEENLKEELEDVPPIQDPLSVFKCKICGSGIREWEYAGQLTYGELHASRRSPDGEKTERFQVGGRSDILCIHCLATANNEELEMWPDISQQGECLDCTLARCWRHGCGCTCHTPTS